MCLGINGQLARQDLEILGLLHRRLQFFAIGRAGALQGVHQPQHRVIGQDRVRQHRVLFVFGAVVLDEALDRLPELQKSLILLRDYEGYSYEEIGKITGLNESQVKVYIFRGRMALKNYLISIENLV